jgi:hypothetical protein
MSNLQLESDKEAHKILFSLEHEMIVIANTIHFSLYCFYLFYELLSYILSLLGYPRLPYMLQFEANTFGRGTLYIELLSKALLLIGSWLGVLGAVTWRVGPLLIHCIICCPIVFYDIFLITVEKFHRINVNDFLLFQTLLTSTLRTARLITIIVNLSFMVYRFTEPETLVI